MSTAKPETLLVKKIAQYLDTTPNCCYEKRHGNMYSEAGQPDLSACINGRRVEIEVKVPSKKAISKGDERISMALWPAYCSALLNSRILFPGNPPTELQVERLLAWESAGAVAFIAYSVEAVREVVEKLQRGEIK